MIEFLLCMANEFYTAEIYDPATKKKKLSLVYGKERPKTWLLDGDLC